MMAIWRASKRSLSGSNRSGFRTICAGHAPARTTATTFSGESDAFPPNFFDDRDGQFLNSFITAGEYAPGRGSSNYVITNATFTATVVGGMFDYDTVRNDGASIELFGTQSRDTPLVLKVIKPLTG